MANEKVLNQVSEVVKSFPHSRDHTLWRARSIEQIIQDKSSTGCTDDALLFKHFASFVRIPVVYVETVEKSWLERLGTRNPFPIEGHVFCDATLGCDIVVPVDPRHGKTEIIEGYYIRDPKGARVKYEVLGKGPDYTQIHLREGDNFEESATRLITEKNIMQAVYKVFKKK